MRTDRRVTVSREGGCTPPATPPGHTPPQTTYAVGKNKTFQVPIKITKSVAFQTNGAF